MELTDEQIQDIVGKVLQSIKTNSLTIDELTGVKELTDGDFFELNNGRKIASVDLIGLIVDLQDYSYAGMAVPKLDPGIPGHKVFYIAQEPGVYRNMGNYTVVRDEIAILRYDKQYWQKDSIHVVDEAPADGNSYVRKDNAWARTLGEGGGTGIVIDGSLNESSTNPVQNKVLTPIIMELQAALFPLSASLTLSKSLLEYTGTDQTITVGWQVRRKGANANPDTLELAQDGTALEITKGATGDVSATVNKKGTTTFKITAEADGLTASDTKMLTMVLPMYFGHAGEDITDITVLSKQQPKTSPAGNYDINNPVAGQYLWLCVPDSMNISSVFLGPTEYPMNDPVMKNTALGGYKCYRGANAQQAMNFEITINA